jgi:hypothetical protein
MTRCLAKALLIERGGLVQPGLLVAGEALLKTQCGIRRHGHGLSDTAFAMKTLSGSGR